MILALPATAWAFDEPRHYWPPEQRPAVLEWHGSPEGFSEEQALVELEAAAALWNQQACIGELLVLQEGTVTSRNPEDQVHAVLFGDPNDELDAGRTGTVYPLYTGDEVAMNGAVLDVPYDVDTVFNDIVFAAEADVLAGNCDGVPGLRAEAAKFFGYVLGITSACDYLGDPCTEAEAAGIMDYTSETCVPAPETLATDDLLALHWLYGTPFDFACVAVADDPHGAECHVGGPALSDITWDLGDGTTADGASVSHSYDAAGEYLVTTCFVLESCGEALCLDHVVYAVDGGDVSALTSGDTETCGCESPAAGAVLPLLLLGRRRRG